MTTLMTHNMKFIQHLILSIVLQNNFTSQLVSYWYGKITH